MSPCGSKYHGSVNCCGGGEVAALSSVGAKRSTVASRALLSASLAFSSFSSFFTRRPLLVKILGNFSLLHCVSIPETLNLDQES
jgi:hypothetical protein